MPAMEKNAASSSGTASGTTIAADAEAVTHQHVASALPCGVRSECDPRHGSSAMGAPFLTLALEFSAETRYFFRMVSIPTSTTDDARRRLGKLGIEFSDHNFFKYLKAGDREVVELFLDSGLPPDLLDSDRNAAVVVARQAGQKDLARLLLARGASPEPLLNSQASRKDGWDKLTASSSVLSFISSLLIAAVGGYFTYSYNQRQIDLNRAQAEHDASTKEQANRVLELEAVQKLIPNLTSADEKQKAAALIAIQDTAVHPELAAHLAVLFGGQGSVQYLEQAAATANLAVKEPALQALSTIATKGQSGDSEFASQALSSLLRNTKVSVVKITCYHADATVSAGSGVVVGFDGTILTVRHVLGDNPAVISVMSSDNKIFDARVLTSDSLSDLSVLKTIGKYIWIPVQFSETPVKVASDVVGIGYVGGQDLETAFVGTVSSVDAGHIYFTSNIELGASGGPVFGTNGEVVGIISSHQNNMAVATRVDVLTQFLKTALAAH